MAKNRRNKKPYGRPIGNDATGQAASSVPKFEIGVKGDEFDLKFTRAAAEKTAGADNLLRSLSKETRISSYNLLNFAVLTLMILFLAMSFALLSRSGDAPRFSPGSFADGSYAAGLSEYYKDTLPFGRALRTLGAYLGFGEAPEPEKGEKPPEEDPDPPVTAPTGPAETTTAPITTDAPTSAPTTGQTDIVKPDTYIMRAKGTVNIRLMPGGESMIMGYFSANDEVEVIEIGSDGWAKIWYNGMIAYVSADYLTENHQSVPETTTRRPSHTTVSTTEQTDETTTLPEEPDETTAPDVTEGDITTSESTADSEQTAAPEPTTTPELTTPEPAATPEPEPEPEMPEQSE